jgi:hypothetical protein
LLFNDLAHVTLHSDALSATLRCDTSNVNRPRARKTGEATIQRATGEASEVLLETAAPVIAVIP